MNKTLNYYASAYSSLIEDKSSFDSLFESLQQTQLMGNQSKILQCCVCAKLNDELNTLKHRSDERKAKESMIIDSLGVSSIVFKKYVTVGKRVLAADDPMQLLDKPMQYFVPPKPKLLSTKPPKPAKPSLEALEADVQRLSNEVEFLNERWSDLKQSIPEAVWLKLLEKAGIRE